MCWSIASCFLSVHGRLAGWGVVSSDPLQYVCVWQVVAKLAELKAADANMSRRRSVWRRRGGTSDVWWRLVLDELQGVERSDEQLAHHWVVGTAAGDHCGHGSSTRTRQPVWKHGAAPLSMNSIHYNTRERHGAADQHTASYTTTTTTPV